MKLFGKEFKYNNNKVYHAGDKPTVNEIGAAASNHNHDTNYLSKTAIAVAATKLATARTINGVAFDGTSNITVAASIPTDLTNIQSIKFGDRSGPIISYMSAYSQLKISTQDMEIGGGTLLKIRQTVLDTLEIDATKIRGSQLNISGTIYGDNTIALARGSLYCGTIGGSLNCDYLRLSANIIGADDSKRIHLLDSGGNGAYVYMDTVVARALGNGGTTLMHNSLDGNNKNLGWSGSKFNQLSAKAVYGDSGNVSDINAKENVREVQTSEIMTLEANIINENRNTIDISYDITRPEMYEFIKSNLKLYLYNYKHTEQFEIEGSFNNKVGFIAQDVADDKVGRTFVGEHEGMFAYNLNNYVFLLTGALQEEIYKYEQLEKRVEQLELAFKS